MSESFIEPESLNSNIFSIEAFADEDGKNRIINSDIMSVDFDGNVPIVSETVSVDGLEAGMSFIIPDTEDLVTVISVDYDNPELVDEPSDDYIVSYLSDAGDIRTIVLDANDDVDVFYEDVSEIALGQTGWAITQGGNAIFNNITARGKIEALSGDIGGWQITPQQEFDDGGIFFNASVEAGESGEGAYLTGIYTGFGIHTDDWEEESDIHQPSKIFMIYGPGLDPEEEENLIPAWNDPKTTFYVDGHGYFSLGDKLTFDANTGELEISGFATEDDLDNLDYLSEEDIFIAGTTNISGNRIRTGILEGLVYRSNASINRTSGDGVYFDDGGYLRVARGSSVLSFNGGTGSLIIEGYATDSELSGGLSGKINNGGAATDVNNNVTTISGGKIRTGIIESNSYSGVTDGTNFSSNGLAINLTTGALTAESFRIDQFGNAAFKGRIEALSGYFGNETSGMTIGYNSSTQQTALETTTLKIGTQLVGGIKFGSVNFYNTSGSLLGQISAINADKNLSFSFGDGLLFGTSVDRILLPGVGNSNRAQYRGNGFSFGDNQGNQRVIITNNNGIEVLGAGDIKISGSGKFIGDGSGLTNVSGGGGGGMTNPMTAAGQIIYGGTSGTPTALAAGTSGRVLRSNGTSAPSWVNSLSLSSLDVSSSQGLDYVFNLGTTPINLNRGSNPATINGLKTSSATIADSLNVGFGTNGQVLGTNGSFFQWVNSLTNPMTTLGDIIYAGSGGTPIRLGVGATGSILRTITSLGVTFPFWLSRGTAGQFLRVNSGGTDIGWESFSGMTNPMTSAGQIIYGGTSGTPTALAAGTSGNVLKSNGAAAPSWTNALSLSTLTVSSSQGLNYTMNFGNSAVNLNRAAGAITLSGVTVDGLSNNTQLFTLGNTAISKGNTYTNITGGLTLGGGPTLQTGTNGFVSVTIGSGGNFRAQTLPVVTTGGFLRYNNSTGVISYSTGTSALKYKNILENNINILDSSWLDDINIVRFKYKVEEESFNESAPIRIGLIADEINNIPALEEIVEKNLDTGEVESIQYDKLSLYLIPIIKELRDKVINLEARLDAAGL